MLSILLLQIFISQGRCFNRLVPSSLTSISHAGISTREDFLVQHLMNSHRHGHHHGHHRDTTFLQNVGFSKNKFFDESPFFMNKSSSKLNGSKLDDDLFDDLSDGKLQRRSENSNGGSDSDDDVSIELLPLADGEELSDELLAQLQQGQPSELAIMKEVSGTFCFSIESYTNFRLTMHFVFDFLNEIFSFHLPSRVASWNKWIYLSLSRIHYTFPLVECTLGTRLVRAINRVRGNWDFYSS